LEKKATPEERQRVEAMLRTSPELERVLDLAREALAVPETVPSRTRRSFGPTIQDRIAACVDWFRSLHTIPRLAFSFVTVAVVGAIAILLFMQATHRDNAGRVYKPERLRSIAVTGAPPQDAATTNVTSAAPLQAQ